MSAARAVVLLLGLGAAACETHASGDYLESELRGIIAEKWGAIAELRCPDRVKIERQVTAFDCQLELASGERGELAVTLNREGRFQVTSK